VIVNVRVPTVIVPVRGLEPVFADTPKLNEPDPVAEPVAVIQDALETAVQEQLGPTLTLAMPPPEPDPIVRLSGMSM